MQGFIDFLISIPGPTFLVCFSLYSILIIYFTSYFLKRYDTTRNLEVPEPTKLSSLEIAILRKGIKGAIVHSIFNLWRKKAITIEKKGRDIYFQTTDSAVNHLRASLKTCFLIF